MGESEDTDSDNELEHDDIVHELECKNPCPKTATNSRTLVESARGSDATRTKFSITSIGNQTPMTRSARKYSKQRACLRKILISQFSGCEDDEQEQRKSTRRSVVMKRKNVEMADLFQAAQNPESVAYLETMVDLPMFANCSMEFIKCMSNVIEVYNFEAGQTLMKAGDCAEFAGWVDDGIFGVYTQGKRASTLQKGETFGETAILFLEEQFSITLHAESDCRVVLFNRQATRACLQFFTEERSKFNQIKTELDSIISELHCMIPGALFQHLLEEPLDLLEKIMPRKVYFAGETIIRAHEPVDSFYLLIQGAVVYSLNGRSVHRAERTRIKYARTKNPMNPEHPVFLGLEESLNRRPNNWNIIAECASLVRILHWPSLARWIPEVLDSLEKARMFFHKTRDGLLCPPPSNIFSGCCEQLIQTLLSVMVAEVHGDRCTIVDESAGKVANANMYWIVHGVAGIYICGEEVATMGKDETFGELTVLGMCSKRTAAVVAKGSVLTLSVMSSILLESLLDYPADKSLVWTKLMNKAGAIEAPVIEGVSSFRSASIKDLRSPAQRAIVCQNLCKGPRNFGDIDVDTLLELSLRALDRFYYTDDVILLEGQSESTMFVIVEGEAAVLKRGHGKISALGPGSVCGELTMLGISPVRTCTLQAASICYVWEVGQEKALPLIAENPAVKACFSQMIESKINKTLLQQLKELPVFDSFGSKYLTFISLRSDKCVAWPGDTIVDEGTRTGGLHVLVRGKVQLLYKGIRIRNMYSGDYFGANVIFSEENMKAIKGHPATVRAISPSYYLKISKRVFFQGVERYATPLISRRFELKELKATKEAFKIMLTIRCKQVVMQSNNFIHKPNLFLDDTNSKSVTRCWEAWVKTATHLRESRAKREMELVSTTVKIQKWLKRKKEMEDAAELGRQNKSACRIAVRVRCCSDQGDRCAVPSESMKAISERLLPSDLRPSKFYKLRVLNVLRGTVCSTEAGEKLLLPIVPTRGSVDFDSDVKLTPNEYLSPTGKFFLGLSGTVVPDSKRKPGDGPVRLPTVVCPLLE